MLLDFLNRPKPKPLLPEVPKAVYRRGLINRRYPEGPHQSAREKERRLVQAAKGYIPSSQFISREAYTQAVENGRYLLGLLRANVILPRSA